MRLYCSLCSSLMLEVLVQLILSAFSIFTPPENKDTLNLALSEPMKGTVGTLSRLEQLERTTQTRIVNFTPGPYAYLDLDASTQEILMVTISPLSSSACKVSPSPTLTTVAWDRSAVVLVSLFGSTVAVNSSSRGRKRLSWCDFIMEVSVEGEGLGSEFCPLYMCCDICAAISFPCCRLLYICC